MTQIMSKHKIGAKSGNVILYRNTVIFETPDEMTCHHNFLICKLLMKNTLLLIALIATIAAAEKYAMVFGTAQGWRNYPVYSV